MGFFSRLFSKKNKKPILGLCLGSGGAKGFAHLGVIKAFEENGVEFDVVGGTSIGSIIGAFYADGYSCTDISGLVSSLNLKEILTGIPFNMDMSGVMNIIDRQIGGKTVEELKKPFVAVATDMDEMKEIVIKKGKVATAVCGSGCFLPFFKPVVDTEGRRLIDGAYMNSIPADRVKELGADFVVGVDLSAFNEYDPDERRAGAAENPKKQGYEFADVMITPDLSGYKSTSFNKPTDMFD
ncbi:MAG: patatin-like phospholipase family protein, partial [Clostridia bacterium]|nr:patatin-like phospholipase family protein [Clostridia bacterium]